MIMNVQDNKIKIVKDSMRRPDIITELDEQTFDLVVSVNKKEAF